MPPKGYSNITVRAEVREELENLRREIGVRDFSDLLVFLVKIYREYTSVTSKIEEMLTNISSKLDVLLTSNTSKPTRDSSSYTSITSKAFTSVSDTHTDNVSRENTNTISKSDKSDEPKPKVFCRSKSEIKDINRYVKKLKDAGVLIDWWDEETKYCFEVKE